MLLERVMEVVFKEHMATWPVVPTEALQDLIFKKSLMQYSKNLAVDCERLYKDLAPLDNEKGMINIKELRDQLIGRRGQNGMLFIWGLKDVRTGHSPIDNNLAKNLGRHILSKNDVDESEYEKPCKVIF